MSTQSSTLSSAAFTQFMGPEHSFFGLQGDYIQEPNHMRARYERDAAMFRSGKTHFQILHLEVSDNLAYWVGFQHGTATVSDRGEITFKLRVMELFRKEGNEWKLPHRQADTLTV
ncbi:YybH family protein [Edaphobacter albus]|uniref:YybH family protein n=1 Tax=Edaphobacter sp. 4G125 TaxID=2763071 RepID=UPI001645D465|nr:DUF4440 domain-containing protein [Edaphobacter sp. 4G125]QNI36028.1 hypothetical protein H7846_13610 [Edaphobacter sp. 4G125]